MRVWLQVADVPLEITYVPLEVTYVPLQITYVLLQVTYVALQAPTVTQVTLSYSASHTYIYIPTGLNIYRGYQRIYNT